eukprot:CAMPEP_0115084074 /NCGR_PEP_ID=MMETSP0227-20121206/21005_1 /TAXON_ID=89957 /ORGANISM="Polarella glacialis, Strain CCMP 1383" /LENGTH=403 /DNA_ID=CAMNT_0002472735 /DNA_START=96 /DNA_END=1307 /DNA_ORIENTATION=-
MSDDPNSWLPQKKVNGFDYLAEKSDGGSSRSVVSETSDDEAETLLDLMRTRTNFALKANSIHLLPEPSGFCEVLARIAAQLGACFAYVIMNANLPIVRFLSKEKGSDYYGYSVGSVLLVTTTSNIILGLVFTKVGGGTISSCFEMRPMLRSSHLSILSVILVVLKFQVLVYLTATLATMLEQFKLITLAAASWAVFGRRYSSVQVMALCSLMLGMVQYALLSSEGGSGLNMKLGLLLQTAFVLISTFSTILREFKLKGGRRGVVEDFSVQQFRIAVPGLLVAIFYYVIESHVLQHESPWMFDGWDWSVISVIIVMLACDWLSNYIQKQLDSIVVQVLGCVTIAVVYVEQHLFLTSRPIDLNSCISLSMVILLACGFAMSTRFTNKYKKLVVDLESEHSRHAFN